MSDQKVLVSTAWRATDSCLARDTGNYFIIGGIDGDGLANTVSLHVNQMCRVHVDFIAKYAVPITWGTFPWHAPAFTERRLLMGRIVFGSEEAYRAAEEANRRALERPVNAPVQSVASDMVAKHTREQLGLAPRVVSAETQARWDQVAAIKTAADKALRFVGGLNLQDHSVKVQREQLDIVRELQQALKPEREGK